MTSFSAASLQRLAYNTILLKVVFLVLKRIQNFPVVKIRITDGDAKSFEILKALFIDNSESSTS